MAMQKYDSLDSQRTSLCRWLVLRLDRTPQ